MRILPWAVALFTVFLRPVIHGFQIASKERNDGNAGPDATERRHRKRRFRHARRHRTRAKKNQSEQMSLVRKDELSGYIPKLIHRTFAREIEKGKFPNPVWAVADASWKRFFPEGEYNYTLWTDESLRTFHKSHCEQDMGPLADYPNSISISDLGRYCVLWQLGGIYTDFDYEPRMNFYHMLVPNRVNLLESPYKRELVQNALMASPPKSRYWLTALHSTHIKDRVSLGSDPPAATGPGLLNSIVETRDVDMVYILPCHEFQRATHAGDVDPDKDCDMLDGNNAHDMIGIHWGTWSWMDGGKTGKGINENNETASLFETLFTKLHPGEKIPELHDNGYSVY